jgi:hypothetical protein
LALGDEFVVSATFVHDARVFFAADAGRDLEERPQPGSVHLSSLYGLPCADSNLWRSFWIAVCAEGALVAGFRGYRVFECLLIAVCAALTWVQWRFLNRGAPRGRFGKREIGLLCAAVLLAFFWFVPWMYVGKAGLGVGAAPSHKPMAAAAKAVSGVPSGGFVGIVLWPPPVKREAIVPPAPRDLQPGAGMAKPLLLRFDGPYWYFKAPFRQPGPKAFVAEGKPTEKTIDSSDWAPLLMEAHQNLGMPIDLACCREIDVAITNADTRPGKIALGMVLTDNGSPGKLTQDLGLHMIASSEAAQISKDRKPVAEVLRFQIPRSATIQKMDAIDVYFVPSKERVRNGAKVSIQSFELIP